MRREEMEEEIESSRKKSQKIVDDGDGLELLEKRGRLQTVKER